MGPLLGRVPDKAGVLRTLVGSGENSGTISRSLTWIREKDFC